jgi:hypothetical protein
MLKIVSVAVLLLLGAVLLFAATRPDTFRVKRATSIKALPEKIFPLINDFKRWGAWSPYEKKDPGMKRSYDGAPAGHGAVYAWEGDGNVGQGRMEIVEASPPGKVAIKLDFTRPFEAHNVVVFTLAPAGGATEVTWDMQGPANYLSKLIGVFVDMDRMVGRDFEVGLANLKAAVEK